MIYRIGLEPKAHNIAEAASWELLIGTDPDSEPNKNQNLQNAQMTRWLTQKPTKINNHNEAESTI